VELGGTIFFPAGSLSNSGHYLAALERSSSAETGSFDVVPATKPAELSFCEPSRVPVGLQDGITGAVYVFDVFRNLVAVPTSVSLNCRVRLALFRKRTVTHARGLPGL